MAAQYNYKQHMSMYIHAYMCIRTLAERIDIAPVHSACSKGPYLRKKQNFSTLTHAVFVIIALSSLEIASQI